MKTKEECLFYKIAIIILIILLILLPLATYQSGFSRGEYKESQEQENKFNRCVYICFDIASNEITNTQSCNDNMLLIDSYSICSMFYGSIN